MDPQDVGFGTGWSFNLSSYQPRRQEKKLFLSTGENYQVTETDDYLGVKDQKLKSFLFKKTDDDYQVVYKPGDIETLSNASDTYDTTVPIELHAANGRSLKFVWTRKSEQPRLQKIQDGSDVLLEIDYSDFDVNIIRAPNTSESSTFTLIRENSLLVKLRLPLEDIPAWQFSYETLGQITCLSSVTSPTGFLEEVH